MCEAVDQPAHQLDHLARNYETAIHSWRARRTSQQSLEQLSERGCRNRARQSCAGGGTGRQPAGQPRGFAFARRRSLRGVHARTESLAQVARNPGIARCGDSERIDSAEPVSEQQPDLLPSDLHPSDLRQYDLPLCDLALAAELRSAQLRGCISGWSKRGCSFGHNGG